MLLTNAAGNPGSGSLVDDQAFKDALAAADVPDDVTWLAYADIPHLAPLVQAFSALSSTKNWKTTVELNKKLGTFVAYGARAGGSTSRFVVRITHA